MNRFSRPGPLAASTGHSPFFKLDLITRFLSGDSRVSFFFPFPSNGSIDRFLAVCSRFRTRNRSAFSRPAGWKTRKELGIAMLVCSSCPRETSFAARTLANFENVFPLDVHTRRTLETSYLYNQEFRDCPACFPGENSTSLFDDFFNIGSVVQSSLKRQEDCLFWSMGWRIKTIGFFSVSAFCFLQDT